MVNYSVKKGDNLWTIIKNQYGLTNSKDIANKVNEVAKANNISNPNSIFAGEKINMADLLPEVVITAAAPNNKKTDVTKSAEVDLSKSQTEVPESVIKEPKPVAEKTVDKPQKEFKFDEWAIKCAESITDIDSKTGEPIYGNEVKAFDMAGEEFVNDLKNNEGKNAGEIYKKQALATSKEEIGFYDKDKDGQISPEEQVKYDIAEAETKFGKFDAGMTEQLKSTSLRANVFMDLDKSGKVDEKEFAAFMYAMDANNEKKIANGKITREEYVKSTGHFDETLTPEAGAFRGTMRASYKGLFGFDPAEKK